MTFLEAKQALAKEFNIDFTNITLNDLFSADDLGTWLNFANLRVWDRHPWDFTSGDKKYSIDSAAIAAGYIDYPQMYQQGSIDLMLVEGVEFKKLDFQDYLKFKSDYPTATDRYWAEHRGWIFFNANAVSVGQEFVFFGKLMFTQLSADGDLMPFSPNADAYEHSGNYAVVLLAKAIALASEKMKNPTQAQLDEQRALAMIDQLWTSVAYTRAFAQPGRPMFEVPDFFSKNSGVDPRPTGNFYFN